MSAEFSRHVDVAAIQYPGRQDRRRECFTTDIRYMAERVAGEIETLDAQVVLYGHSMGALVAFETARLLETSRQSVRSLVVSGRSAPDTPRPPDDTDLEALTREMAKLDGTKAEVFEDQELLTLILGVMRHDYQAVNDYVYRPEGLLKCPVTVVIGSSDPIVSASEAADWRAVTTGRFELRTLAGGHFFQGASALELRRILMTHIGNVCC